MFGNDWNPRQKQNKHNLLFIVSYNTLLKNTLITYSSVLLWNYFLVPLLIWSQIFLRKKFLYIVFICLESKVYRFIHNPASYLIPNMQIIHSVPFLIVAFCSWAASQNLAGAPDALDLSDLHHLEMLQNLARFAIDQYDVEQNSKK